MKNAEQTTGIHDTRNPEWGFWGTMGERAAEAWPVALTAISDATAQPVESVRAFLDSRHGRHFADSVLDQFADNVLDNPEAEGSIESAIRATVTRWMDWRIGPRTSREYGIPKGLPYLTGFVIHGEIAEELSA